MTSSRRLELIGFMCVLLILSAFAAVGFGSVPLSPETVIGTFLRGGEATTEAILFDIRLPRVGIALFVGANLALSGALLQVVMNNALADPGLTGVSSGAAVTVLAILLLVPELGGWIPLAAVSGGALAVLLVYVLAWTPGKLPPGRIVLSGVAVNAVAGGIIGLLSLLYSDRLPGALQWLNGSLAGKSADEVLRLMLYSLPAWVVAVLLVRYVNVLRLDEEVVTGLGGRVTRIRFIISGIAVYLAAVSVATVGILGFVGLIVPHLTRFIVGNDYRFAIPMNLVLGALILLLADTVGRTSFAPLDIPAGIIMSLIGGPYFLYLLRKKL